MLKITIYRSRLTYLSYQASDHVAAAVLHQSCIDFKSS